MEPSSSQSSTPASFADLASPQPLALNEILRFYPRNRLAVHPWKWTSRQLELLGCSFEPPAPAPRQRERHEPPHSDRRPTPATLARRLATAHVVGYRKWQLRALFANKNGPLVAVEGGFLFHYCRRPIDSLSNLGFSFRSETEGANPMPLAVWTEPRLICTRRCDKILPSYGGRLDTPVQQLGQLRLKAAAPREPLHDPGILALLISVAQGQQIVLEQDKAGQWDRWPSFRSHVIWTHYKDEEHVHLFSADIPPALLDMFDSPSLVPRARASVRIRHTMVPFKPYKTLYSRLIELILPHSYAAKYGQRGKRKPETDDADVPQEKGSMERQEAMNQVASDGEDAVFRQQCQAEG